MPFGKRGITPCSPSDWLRTPAGRTPRAHARRSPTARRALGDRGRERKSRSRSYGADSFMGESRPRRMDDICRHYRRTCLSRDQQSGQGVGRSHDAESHLATLKFVIPTSIQQLIAWRISRVPAVCRYAATAGPTAIAPIRPCYSVEPPVQAPLHWADPSWQRKARLLFHGRRP